MRLLSRAAFAFALAALAATAAAARLTDAEAAGKKIYTDGVSSSGEEIVAIVGMAHTRVPAKVVTCAGCHGADGLGRPEGGLVPPPVTWTALAKERLDASGRMHAAYSEKTLARALGTGVDPGGYQWNPGMPRYVLSRRDVADLIAYLKRIDTDFDPGVGDSTLRIGTLLPVAGPAAEAGRAMRAVLEGRIAEINAGGGIYGRKLELVTAAREEHAEGTLHNARGLLDDDVFALLAPFVPGEERELAALAEERRVPVVGPFTLLGPTAQASHRYTFYLFSGLAEQAQVLVSFGLERLDLGRVPLAIVYPRRDDRAAVADLAAQRCADKGCARVVRVTYASPAFDAAEAVARARAHEAGVVLFLGSEAELERFAAAAAAEGWRPALLVAAVLAARAAQRLPAGFAERVFLAYPTTPADRTPHAERELAAFRERHALSAGPALAQVSAYVATTVFTDALRRAGRALSRDRFVAALEAAEFTTGLSMPLRYGPQRRIGALGGYVVARSGEGTGFRPASGWIRLE